MSDIASARVLRCLPSISPRRARRLGFDKLRQRSNVVTQLLRVNREHMQASSVTESSLYQQIYCTGEIGHRNITRRGTKHFAIDGHRQIIGTRHLDGYHTFEPHFT